MIASEGPLIVRPDAAKTNPTSMRDNKLKVDNPAGKKILTPRGGHVTSTSAHTAGANSASKNLNTALHKQLQSKHYESISSGVGAKSGGNRQMITTATLSEIDKKHLGMQPSSTKKMLTGSGSKVSGGRGTGGGSIDLQTGATSMTTLVKSKSIHGQKVSEVTVQSNSLIKPSSGG